MFYGLLGGHSITQYIVSVDVSLYLYDFTVALYGIVNIFRNISLWICPMSSL